MSIVVRHGGSATIALGREAGIAQGEAAAAEIKARQDRELAQTLLQVGNDVARGISHHFDQLHHDEDLQKQRDFTSSENALNRQSREYTTGIRDQGQTDRTQMLESGRNNRLADSIQSKEGMAADSLSEKRSHNLASEDQGQQKIDNSLSFNLGKNENRSRTLDLQEQGLGVKQANLDLQASKIQQQADKTAQLKAMQDERTKAEKQLHDAIDHDNAQRNGGVIVPDLTWAQQHAAVKHYGYLPKNLYDQLHGSFGGAQVTAQPLKDDQYATIAIYDPVRAHQIAGIVDPASVNRKTNPNGNPTAAAQKMQQAMLQMVNAPQFNPKDNPQYFQNMERSVDEWSKYGPPDPASAQLIQKYEQERQRRAVTLLPQVVNQIKSIRGIGDPATSRQRIELFLNQSGVSEDELERYAEDYAASHSGGMNAP